MARKPIVSIATLALMRERGHHAWTLDELRDALAERDTAADFSSIFRAAERLVADGLVRRLTLEDGRSRFELAEAHHDHLHCTSCGDLVPVPCVVEHADFAALERATGIAVLNHHLVLSGLCRECRAAA
jgi:Fur family ferric uptake transcriptional regulator